MGDFPNATGNVMIVLLAIGFGSSVTQNIQSNNTYLRQSRLMFFLLKPCKKKSFKKTQRMNHVGRFFFII